MPTISVVMSAYNAEHRIAEAISSILKQTNQDFELVVIDDGSTDQTVEMVNRFLDERIIVISVQHIGLPGALNSGIRVARGKFIARMDADDQAHPDRLERQYRYLMQHSRVCAVGTAYEVIQNSGERTTPKVPLLATSLQIKKTLPRFNPFFHGSMMIRREVFNQCGSYAATFELAQDYDLWFRIAKRYEMANLDEILMWRREGWSTLEKEARQNWYGIKARWKAIRQGNIPIGSVIHLVRPLGVAVLPVSVKGVIRKIMRSE